MASDDVNILPSPWNKYTPRQAALLIFAVIGVGGSAVGMLEGVRSNWYYPYIVALGIIGFDH